jgi:hypothetical protein
MKRFTFILFLTFVAIAVWTALAHARPRHRRQRSPFVYGEGRGFDRCAPGDANGPCYGRRFSVMNPCRETVVVTVGCPYNRDLDTKVAIGPRQHSHFDLGIGEGSLSPNTCGILAWYVWRWGDIHDE